MSPDFRYHVASLASIFLALGVGVLIGTAFVGTPFVKRLENRIRRQETQIAALETQARGQRGNEEALRNLVPRLIAGSLIGINIVVVQLGDDSSAADAAADAVLASGGTCLRLTLPDAPWRTLTSAERDRQARLLAQTLRGNMEASQLMEDVLVKGNLPPATVRRVVLAGGNEELRAERDIPLARALSDDGCRVVGVEMMDATPSAVRSYKAEQVSFVDCVDRAVGQIALSHVLRGEKGAFGLKSDADRVLPAVVALRRSAATPSPAPSPAAP